MGKFTVAKKLHEQTGYKFFHNHHTHDLARQLFERGNKHADVLMENLRFFLFKEVGKAKINAITTHTFSSDYVSLTGLRDPLYMKKIESIIEKEGGKACFVHLIPSREAILKRVQNSSRSQYMKLRNKKLMKEILNTKDWKTNAPVANNLTIDNTKLSPKKVSDMIIKYLKLKP